MKDNKHNKIIIGSIVGAIILLLVIVGVVYSKGTSKVENEVATTEQVDVDSVMSDVADASIGDTIEETTSTVASTVENITEEATTEVSEEIEANKEETVSETATSESTETVVIEATTNTSANTDTVQTSTTSNKVNGYKGNGNGPGAAYRSDFDYSPYIQAHGDLSRVVVKTAPNGVQVKCYPYEQEGKEVYAPIVDGEGKDLEPNSPFMEAVNYFIYNSDSAYLWKTDFSAVDATLPTTSFKRTNLDVNDASLKSYQAAINYKRDTMDGGTPYERTPGVINDSLAIFSDGIGEYNDRGGTIWEFDHTNGYWRLSIYQNLAAYQWDAVKQVLHYLDPNGDALYQVIYEDVYTGRQDIMPTYDDWYSYSGSQIMISDTTNLGYMVYGIK